MAISPQQQSKGLGGFALGSIAARSCACNRAKSHIQQCLAARERKLRVQWLRRAFVGGPAFRDAVRATTRATIGPKEGCADEFFRERRDRSAPLPELSRIRPPTGPDR